MTKEEEEDREDKENALFLSTKAHMELVKRFKFYKLTGLNWDSVSTNNTCTPSNINFISKQILFTSALACFDLFSHPQANISKYRTAKL